MAGPRITRIERSALSGTRPPGPPGPTPGLAARVEVRAAEAGLDALRVNGLEGTDTLAAQTLPAGVINLVLDGGAGDDTLDGGAGADVGLNGEALINIP